MKVLIDYNAKSGNGMGKFFAEQINEKFKSLGVETQVFTAPSLEENFEFFKNLKQNNVEFDALVILGGDGTIGRCVNAMLKNNLNYPIAPFPIGTANDFCWYLKMPRDVDKLVDCIMNTKPIKSDVASVNNEFVINVIGGGLYTNGYTKYPTISKKFFGKLAYWFVALFESFKVRYQRFSINIDGEEIREDLCFFSVLNGSSAGGMNRLGIDAKIDDGYFEFVAFKRCNVFKRFWLFTRVVSGKHKNNKNLIYKRGRQFSIKPIHTKEKGYTHCDIDGDKGPDYPLHIKVHKAAIQVFTRNKKLRKN